MRLRAIFCCLYFGVVPSFVYEPKCHHNGTYLTHLKLNLEMVLIWLFFQETQEDVEFESQVNQSWSFVLGKLFRWQKGSSNKHF